MALTNAEKQHRHRERMKTRLMSDVMSEMEKYLESRANWLRNHTAEHQAKGRQVMFRIWHTGGYACYEVVGYVTDRIDESVFKYMVLRGMIERVEDIPRYWNCHIYQLIVPVETVYNG